MPALHPTPAKVTDAAGEVLKIMPQQQPGKLGTAHADDKNLDILVRIGQARKMVLPWQQLGFHPSNRDGLLGDATVAPLLLNDIGVIGWSGNQCSHALCIEARPGCYEAEEMNRKRGHAFSAPLAPVGPYSINFLTLAVGHTT